jgi:hypothetical protein
MSNKKNQIQKASVTFEMPSSRKGTLELMAHRLGLRRLRDGEERGNLSLLLNLFAEYTLEHLTDFQAWIAARVTLDKP